MVKFYYAKEPSSIKLMGNLFSFLSLFTRMPKTPAENECCNTCYLTDYAFTPENLDIMLNLVKNLNNLLVDTACINIIAPLDPDDQMTRVCKNFKPFIETWNVYAKWFGNVNNKFKPLYTDIRDLIM